MKFWSSWLEDSTDGDSDANSPHSKWSLLCLVTVFLVLAAVLCSDEFRHLDSLPLKSTDVATVPLFNAWTIGWNADRLWNGLEGYWDAPIFYPTNNAFAFSEPQPATMLVAPVVWASGSAVTGYKIWMALSLAFNGFFTALLLRRFGYALFHQMVAGVAIMLLPIIHQRIDVLQLVPVWGILWFWSSVFQLLKYPGWRTSVETGLAFTVCFGLCVHHALFLTLLLPFAGVVLLPAFANRNVLLATIGAIVVAVPLTLPIVLPIKAAAETHEFVRDAGLVKRLSALPKHYLVSQDNALVDVDYFEGPRWREFCVGWWRMGLALIGVVYGLVQRKRRRWVLFIALTGAFAFAFSLGLNLDVFGWKPWQFLTENLPGFGQVRSVYRFVWFVQMVIVLLAVEGISGLHAACRKWLSHRFSKTAMACLVILPGAVLACEVLPEPTKRGGIPFVDDHSGWIEFVRDNASAGSSVACLPFATGTGVEDYDVTTRWMLYGLRHKIPMINGYSGFFPNSYISMRDWMNEKFPSADALSELIAFDAELVVVARSYCEPKVMLGLASETLSVELVFEDLVGMDVYRLQSID